MRGWRKFRYRPMALCFKSRFDTSFSDSYRLPEASHSEYPPLITVDLLLASSLMKLLEMPIFLQIVGGCSMEHPYFLRVCNTYESNMMGLYLSIGSSG
jgi:hypothetical protein